jgi:hypothetical protein
MIFITHGNRADARRAEANLLRRLRRDEGREYAREFLRLLRLYEREMERD